MPISEETRADIYEVFDEIHVELAMAKNGVETAKAEASERDVRYAVSAALRHLQQVGELTRELETHIDNALRAAEAPEKAETPPAARTGRSARARRGE